MVWCLPSRLPQAAKPRTPEFDEEGTVQTTASQGSRLSQETRLPSGSGFPRSLPPVVETKDLESLKTCQREALFYIRQMCRPLHDAALPRLTERARQLGFDADDVTETLAWIRDEAPIIVHVDLGSCGSALASDTNYRNQFETNTSQGTKDVKRRAAWEEKLFNGAYVGAKPLHCCKYGVLNATNDPQGVRACKQYGWSYLRLRGVRLRTTFSAEDSASMGPENLATVDYYAHVLEQYADEELLATLEVGTKRLPGTDSRAIRRYKEAQVHGEIQLAEHVELIMAHPSLRTPAGELMLQRLATRCKAPLIWIQGGVDTAITFGSAPRPAADGEPDEEEEMAPPKRGGLQIDAEAEYTPELYGEEALARRELIGFRRTLREAAVMILQGLQLSPADEDLAFTVEKSRTSPTSNLTTEINRFDHLLCTPQNQNSFSLGVVFRRIQNVRNPSKDSASPHEQPEVHRSRSTSLWGSWLSGQKC